MSAVVYDAILGDLTLLQVRRTNYKADIEPIYGDASGAAAPSVIYGGRGEPSADFESFDVAGVLDGLSITAGLNIAAGTITIPWNQRANGGTFAGALSHYTLNATSGLVVPTEFSANQDDEGARAMLNFWARSSNGVTFPITASINQTLAAQAFNAQYALGPATINGTAISKVIGIRVVPGLEIIRETSDGGNYPVDLFIRHTRPMIEITFRDMNLIQSIGTGATVMTSCVAYFRKRSGATFVADATLEHIQFSMTDGLIICTQNSGNHTDSGVATLMCYGELLAVDTTAAIA